MGRPSVPQRQQLRSQQPHPVAARRPSPTRGRVKQSHFPFRAATFGNITVALAPDRGRSADRRADYHDPPCRRAMH